MVTQMHMDKYGTDYRYEVDEHPVPELRDRKNDNVSLGR